MRSHHRYSLLSALLLPGLLHAADQGGSPAEAKLRESLKNTMLQLRTAETERANLQAAQAESDAKLKAATEQVAALGKQLAADKDTADKTIAGMQTKIDERDKALLALKASLDQWKADHKKIADIAATKEQQRAKFEAQSIELKRVVADQKVKNAEMYKIGNEVLSRYEKFGLGDALTAREPFVGITRVKFENLIQDFGDKLTDAKIKP